MTDLGVIKGFRRKAKPLELLADQQVEAILEGTLDVLEKKGARIDHQDTLSFLAEQDCIVDFDTGLVKIPQSLAVDCLKKCPSSFIVKARDPKLSLQIDLDTLYFCNSIGMNLLDLDTWETRKPTVSDNIEAVRVLHSLDTVHFLNAYFPYMELEGVAPCMTLVEGMANMFRNSTKVMGSAYQQDSEIFAIKMARAVGMDLIGGVCASPPLTYDAATCKVVRRWTEAGFPLDIGSGAVMGGTAPVTIAGATITNNAELLAGIVLAQLLKPGVGIAVGDFVHPLDMRRGTPVFGAMECALHQVVFNQFWRKYGIPTHSWYGFTNAKKVDFQSGYERSMTALVSALSGASIIDLHGAVYGELAWNPAQAVLDDDLAGWIGRFMEGVEFSEETLAVDLIKEIGPIPGNYLGTAHTRKWWKRSQFIPRCADRDSYPEWVKSGKRDALSHACARMEQILASCELTPLTGDQDRELSEILEEARSYYRLKGLMSS
jgi:trimethylamine--corrinoid protein Co-methyltransferase